MKIGVLTAMTSEFEQLAAMLDGVAKREENNIEYLVGYVGKNEIILRQCGIGKVNAAVGTAELIRSFAPDAIVSTGVAGGIDTSLDVMDVVVSSSIVYHDVWCGMGCEYGQIQGMPAVFAADEKLCGVAESLNGDPENITRIHAGLICTSFAPAVFSIVIKFAIVVPRTMESSMKSSFLSLISACTGISFIRAIRLR